MEALALEVPVVVSTAGGTASSLGEDAGRVVPIGDVPALAAAMDWMVEHPDEVRRMGIRGRSRMVERYDVRVLIRMHERLYSSLLAERRGPDPAAT